MKRLTLLLVCSLLGFVYSYAQPNLLEHVTFESGLPSGWVASTNASVTDVIASTGEKSFRMQPSSTGMVTLTSPVYNITANSGVRLEFSQIPLLKNKEGGADMGGYLQIKVGSGEWLTLNNGGNSRTSPGDLDVTYGQGETWASVFSGFSSFYYWNQYFGTSAISLTDLLTYLGDETNDYYNIVTWKNAVFYLADRLTSSGTSFQLRFVIPQYSTANANAYSAGWFIDDIRLYVAATPGDEVRVPQITNKVSYPNMMNYPNCSDALISLDLRDNNGAISSVPDSLYVEYFTDGDSTIRKVLFTHNTGVNYSAVIPYAGVDSVISWRAVINDHKGNVTTFPFAYGQFNRFRSVLPYVGNEPIKTSGLSSQAVVFNTAMTKTEYQIRYKAQEMLEAGFGPGKLAGISMNLTEAAAGTVISQFKISVSQIPASKVLDNYAPETGLQTVYSRNSYTIPSTGWTYFSFDDFDPNYVFVWDGTSDILIKTCYENKTGSGTTKVECFSSNQSVLKFESATSNIEACMSSFDVVTPYLNYKPNFKFNFENTCHFQYDAAVSRAKILQPTPATTCSGEMPTTAFCTSGTPSQLKVYLRNDGTDVLQSIKVSWMLNDDPSTVASSTWNGTLSAGDSVQYLLTSNFLPPVGEHKLSIWTEMVDENTIDWNYNNDTAFFTLIVSEGAMNGEYAIGEVNGISANRTFTDFESAFLMLINSGVNAPVSFKIKYEPHKYDSIQVKFPNCIQGLSATNTITFEGESATQKPIFFSGDTTAPVFTLDNVHHFIFKNLRFNNNGLISDDNANISVVRMIQGTSDIKFIDCDFATYGESDGYNTRIAKINSILNIGASNNVEIDGCTFSGAATNQISIIGFSPLQPSNNVVIKNSTFNISQDYFQAQNGNTSIIVTGSSIYAQYTKNLVLNNNVFKTNYLLREDGQHNYTTVNYALTLLNAKTQIERNNFVLEGISAMSLSQIDSSRIANNKISLNRYELGTAYITYGINFLTGNKDTIVYNNIYGKSLDSYDKRVVGLNLGSGQSVENVIVKNNIIVSDGYGFASVVRPEGNVNASYTLSNNLYYKTSSVENMPLLSYNGSTSTSVGQWTTLTQETASYYDQDPIFPAWNNLDATNTLVCEQGTNIPSITTDFYGSERPTTTNPCIGAREFTPPQSNVYVISTGLTNGNFDGASSYTNCDFGTESVFVSFQNLSANIIPSSSAIFKYRVNNGSTVTETLPFNIEPDSVYTYVFNTTKNFATTGTADETFTIRTWSAIPEDTVNNNDTAYASVISLYQLPALTPQSQNVNYGTEADLTVSINDSVYWYLSESDEIPTLKSQTYHIPVLYHDTTFYFSRKSEIPVLKITEIQLSKAASAVGVTENLPAWVSSNTAIEISNFGSGDLNMTGYKLYVSKVTGSATELPTTGNNYKTYNFPNNYVLRAGTSVVLLAANSTTEDDTVALATSLSSTFANQTAKTGFVIANANNTVVDAVAINGATFASSVNVPSSVWSSTTLNTAGSAGIIRTANTTTGWQVASNNNKMTIGTFNAGLQVYRDNGCFGDKTPYNVVVTNAPINDIALTDIRIVNYEDVTSSCAMGNETIVLTMTNSGINPTASTIPLVCEVYDGETLVSTINESYSSSLNQFDTVEYTFTTPIDMSANTVSRDLTIKVYLYQSTETITFNDTISTHITSLVTPSAPVVAGVTIPYATTATLSSTSNNIVVWYENQTTNEELARGTFTTPILYEDQTYYVGSILVSNEDITVGNGTLTNATSTTGYPGPLNCKQKNVKEQYLLKAENLQNAGFTAGNINSIAFDVATVSVGNGQPAARLLNYNVKLGQTQNAQLSSWVSDMTTVYSTDQIDFQTTNTGWYSMTFDDPYYWDGVSNLVVEVCFSSPNTNSYVTTRMTATDYKASCSYRSPSNAGCTWTGNPTKLYDSIPNMKFNVEKLGCTSERLPVQVTVESSPSCEVGLESITSPSEDIVMSGETNNIEVVLKNYGSDNLTSANISWSVNGAEPTVYNWTGNLAGGETQTVVIGTYTFTPGSIELVAYVDKDCDIVKTNDTVSKTFSACLGNNTSVVEYTISATDEDADFSSFTSAVDALKESGLCGPVIFNVAAGTYNEQVEIPEISGISETNTVTFRGETGETLPILTYSVVNASTYASLILDETSHIYFENIEIQSASSSYPDLVRLITTNDIKFSNVIFSSLGTVGTTLVKLEGQNMNTEFTNNTFTNGLNFIVSNPVSIDSIPQGLKLSNNVFSTFTNSAISLNTYLDVEISNNKIRAYDATVAGTAISVKNIGGVSSINSNDIFVEKSNKVRVGINVKGSDFTMLQPMLVYNNAVAINGITGSTAINSIGIDIDSSSYVYAYYNTVRVYPSTNSASSIAMKVGGHASNINVRNNNFENAGKGFAYHVTSANSISISNNNNYYTTGTKLAYWGANIANIDALRTANSMDEASTNVTSPFASDSLLKLTYPTDIVYGAEPIEEINTDIFGRTRPVSPHPTMGAYEYVFPTHDAGVTEIVEPVNTISYVEGDPITITARLKNFGLYSLTSMDVVVNLKTSEDGEILQTITGHSDQVLAPLELSDYTFTTDLIPPLNDPYTDSLYVEVYTVMDDDAEAQNDTAGVYIKVIPAYNVYVQKTQPITERCQLHAVPIQAVIQNKGEKTIDNSQNLQITYEVQGRPDLTVTEQITFPYTDPEIGLVQSLQKNATMTYVFNQLADLYPLGNSDTVWKLRTYITCSYDHVPVGSNSNDTSAYINVTSRRSPNPPVTHNDTIDYGTHAMPTATQENNLAIKWYTSTSDAEPFYAPTNYQASTRYTTPDRMYQNETYYLRVNLTGSYPCASDFAPVSIIVKDREPVEMAANRVITPYITEGINGRVYTEEDTVSVELVNYGTQNATNFNVTYSLQKGNQDPILVTETCHDVVAPDATYTYKFNTLADLSEVATYRIIAWVKATGDNVPKNDTTETVFAIKPLNGNTVYPNGSVQNGESLDIVRVQMGTTDNSSVAGSDTYTDFTQTVPPIILFKGTTDSLIVHNAKAPAMEVGSAPQAWMKVYIDWDRDGVFDPNTELMYSDTVYPDQSINRTDIQVPIFTFSGKTRMRIMLAQEDLEHSFEPTTQLKKGEVEDYLLNILPIEETNAQLVRFITPERFVSDANQQLKVRLRNMGKSSITSATITWSLNDGAEQTYNWTGNLATSASQDITISNLNLQYGNNTIKAVVSVLGDTYPTDDSLEMNVFLFNTYDISYAEEFDAIDVPNSDFYPYELNPSQPTNCWQMGTPGEENTIITQAYSEPNCWKTNINGKYPKNNQSILYSPVFNIELIKPDTLGFMLRTVLGSANMTVEYADYRGNWQRLGSYGTGNNEDTNGYNWYNSEDGFTGNNGSWKQVYYSLDHLLANMGITVQFRFVFESGNSATTEGVAIDNFELRRGLRDRDAGVTSIELTPTLLPNYGSYFYPKVNVHNFGKAPLSSVRVCYMSEDMHIPTCEDLNLGENGIAPGGDYEYTFISGHYLDVTMPDPFTIVSFTRLQQDLYQDNDSVWANIVIGPLEKDAAIVAIENPGSQIVSNDDIEIGIRVRNYGLTPITELPVAYAVSGGNVVEEVITFNPPLYNGDEYVYRFNHTYHAPYGSVNLKSWVGLEGDYYHDNDTLYKRLEGTNYTQDIEARYITIDDTDPNSIGVQLAFLNRSSRGVGNIRVGYFYDNNPGNAVEETYRLGSVLPAGEYGYHYFAQKLQRRVYQSICAYVIVDNEVDKTNDTTCAIYMGYKDGVADSIFIEQTVAEDCLVQLVGHNGGTIGGVTPIVTAHLVIDGNWNNVITETFTWDYDEPNPNLRRYMTFSYRIPKSENGQYNILAWLDYPSDAAHWNDTTHAYQVKSYVGLEDSIQMTESGFILEQNTPNPLKDQTRIGFVLPQAGEIQFYVTNTVGQIIYTKQGEYKEGRNFIDFDASQLEEGVYYYVMTYKNEKQMKKMIIIR